MKINAVVPVLWVPDIPASLRFYQEVLGFECASQAEGWVCIQRDGVELMLSAPNAHYHYDGPRFTGSFYFKLDTPKQVNEFWQQVKDKATVVYPIENFDYGMREFAIHDNHGFILQFGAELPQ
jgi:uncharacterized glyoxalase superfamily protein PhnB